MGDDWLANKLFDWWLNSVWWIRVGTGLVLLLFGVFSALWLIFWQEPGSISTGRGLIGSIFFIGLGLALMVAGGKSRSEKNGYHF
jgi:hypothetical protein